MPDEMATAILLNHVKFNQSLTTLSYSETARSQGPQYLGHAGGFGIQYPYRTVGAATFPLYLPSKVESTVTTGVFQYAPGDHYPHIELSKNLEGATHHADRPAREGVGHLSPLR